MGHVQDRWFTSVKDPSNPKKTVQQPTSRCGVGKRYRARVIGPDGGEISESFADGQDKAAQEWINTTEAKITLGIYESPQASKKSKGMPLLKPFASDYIADHDMDEASREILEMRFGKHIFPHLGEMPLDEINASSLRSWDSKLRKDKLSDRYRHTLFMNLSAVMNAAVDDEVIDKNPCEGKSIKKPKPTKKKIVPWPASRVSAVRRGLPERFRVGTNLGAGLGMRQGECFGVAVEDIDRRAREVRIVRQIKTVRNTLVFALPKNKKTRTVPLPDHVERSIDEHMERFPPVPITLPWETPDGPLVTVELIMTSMRGLPIRANDFDRNYWKPALVGAGVPAGRYENGMHDLRHLYASVLLDGGESIKTVSELLGHADPAFTLATYTHLIPENIPRTKGVIDGFLAQLHSDGPETAQVPAETH
ncbi:site-specific integrase [Lentzea sp. DG1S-22]|uniref:tyrosine-type recombinase/integrase n=1 Tax=Lentzea sp. DG1S-22 TaxID=3108822 RepID=UPI002E78431E|nr:site-specific integrase [Lentzea sp. DG1S-22]WVH79793.1 site-specific integrase [Lentzea sp. DG1S-22]